MRPESFNEDFLKWKIGPTIDRWEKEGTKYVNLSYWIDKGKQRYRINVMGSTLDECVDKAQIQEALICA